jgi:hypothetical protein
MENVEGTEAEAGAEVAAAMVQGALADTIAPGEVSTVSLGPAPK